MPHLLRFVRLATLDVPMNRFSDCRSWFLDLRSSDIISSGRFDVGPGNGPPSPRSLAGGHLHLHGRRLDGHVSSFLGDVGAAASTLVSSVVAWGVLASAQLAFSGHRSEHFRRQSIFCCFAGADVFGLVGSTWLHFFGFA